MAGGVAEARLPCCWLAYKRACRFLSSIASLAAPLVSRLQSPSSVIPAPLPRVACHGHSACHNRRRCRHRVSCRVSRRPAARAPARPACALTWLLLLGRQLGCLLASAGG